MEAVKKHWPQIAVGVVAIAVSLYLLNRNQQSKNMAAVLVDIDQIRGKDWPHPRRILNSSVPLIS
jgi:hypothetical protein